MGSVGLAVSQSMVLTMLLQMAARFTADFLAQMTAVERMLEYTNLPKEENLEVGSKYQTGVGIRYHFIDHKTNSTYLRRYNIVVVVEEFIYHQIIFNDTLTNEKMALRKRESWK